MTTTQFFERWTKLRDRISFCWYVLLATVSLFLAASFLSLSTRANCPISIGWLLGVLLIQLSVAVATMSHDRSKKFFRDFKMRSCILFLQCAEAAVYYTFPPTIDSDDGALPRDLLRLTWSLLVAFCWNISDPRNSALFLRD